MSGLYIMYGRNVEMFKKKDGLMYRTVAPKAVGRTTLVKSPEALVSGCGKTERTYVPIRRGRDAD